MFRRLFSKTKPRVFLNQLTVVPRTDFIKKNIETLGHSSSDFNADDFHRLLIKKLNENFPLPHVSEEPNPDRHELGLDITISKYQLGLLEPFWFFEIFFLFLWRPKITVVARLFYLRSGKTKKVIEVTHRINWRKFLSSKLFWNWDVDEAKAMQQDLVGLLNEACIKILARLAPFQSN